jgi:hypothetical protein
LKLNIDDLRRHYASLSDEALRAIDRTELVEIARQCYDQELAQRVPLKKAESPPRAAVRIVPLDESEQQEDIEDAAEDEMEEQDGGGDAPEWLEEAACVCTFAMFTGGSASVDAENARDILTEAGIPCHVTLRRVDPNQSPPPRSEYRVMVPGGLNLDAASVLDKEIFNAEIEAEWRAHFAELSDDDLLGVNQEVLFAGLLDRVERVRRAYDEEVARRTKTSGQ